MEVKVDVPNGERVFKDLDEAVYVREIPIRYMIIYRLKNVKARSATVIDDTMIVFEPLESAK